MRVFSKKDKLRKVFLISVLALTSLIIVSASNSEVLACSRSGNSGGPNPDTGGALDGNYQFVKTDSSGTVLAVSYGTNTVGSAPSGGNVWSNNGTWGNVQVGGSIKSESSGNIYYPPGCSPTTTTTSTTTTTTTTTTPVTTTTTTSPATTTTTTLAKTTTSCSRSGNSGGPNPDTGGALVAGYQYVKTDSTGIVLTVSYGSNNVGQGVSGGNIWSNNGAWGNVQVGGSIKSENSGNIYYPPGCTPPITTSTVTTTTSSTTTTSTTTTTIKPASSTTVQPIVNTAINSGSASTTTTIATLFDDGSEQQEVIADITLQKSSNNYLIRVTSNQEKTAVEIIARKKGAKNIIWKLVTDSNGAKQILTSRNLKGFTLALRIDGETIDTAKG